MNWLAKRLQDVDGVVNLAGAPIIRRWTPHTEGKSATAVWVPPNS